MLVVAGSGKNFLLTLNAAAVAIEQAISSEIAVLHAFEKQVLRVGTSGIIWELDDGYERVSVRAVAIIEAESRTQGSAIDKDVTNIRTMYPLSMLLSKVVIQGQPVFVPDFADEIASLEPEFIAGHLDKFQTPAIIVPLTLGEKLWGVMALCSGILTQEDVPAVDGFAQHVSVALENARLFAQFSSGEGVEKHQAGLRRVDTTAPEKSAGEITPDGEEIFRQVMRQSLDGLVLVDNQGMVIEWSEGQEEIVGLPRDQVLGRAIWDIQYELAPPEKRTSELYQRVWQEIQHAIQRGQAAWVNRLDEVEIVRPDGERRTIETMTFPIKTGQGYIFASILRDTTFRKKMEQKLQQSAAAMKALHALSLDITTLSDFNTLLSKMVDRAKRLLSASGGAFYGFDRQKKKLELLYESFYTDKDYTGSTLDVGEGVAGVVVESGDPLIVDNYRVWPHRAAIFEAEKPYTAVIGVPVNWRGEIIGVLQVLDNNQERQFTQDDQYLLTQFANMAAVAFANTRSLNLERQRRQEAELLSQAMTDLVSILDLESLLGAILTRLKKTVSYDSAAIFLNEGEQLRIVAARGFADSRALVGHAYPVQRGGLFAEIVAENRPIILENAQDDSRFNRWEATEYVRGWMGLPLRASERVIGYITLDSRIVGAYSEVDASVAGAFANQAALAIEKARLFEAERSSRERAEILMDVASAVSTSMQLDDVLRVIMLQLKRILHFDTSSVLLFEFEDEPALFVSVGYDDENLTSQAASISLMNSPILARMQDDHQPVIISDVSEDPDWIWVPGAEHVHSFLAVPILYGTNMIGALMADSTAPRFFKSADAQAAQSLAHHMAVAIQNARLFEAERQQLTLAKTLQEVGAVLTSEITLDAVLEKILDLLGRVVDYDSVSIQLLGEDGQLYLAAGRGFPDLELAKTIVHRSGERTIETKWRKPEVLVIKNTHQDERWDIVPGFEYIRSWVGAPLLVKGRFIGSLNVDSRKPDRYTRKDGQTVMALANQAAIAIENARLFNAERIARARAEALHEAARSIGTTLSLDQVLELVLEQLGRVIPYHSSSVMLLDEERLHIMAARGFDAENLQDTIQNIRFDLDRDFPAARVVRSGKPLVVLDAQLDPKWIQTSIGKHIRSWLGVPLLVRGEPIGLINIDRSTTQGFSSEEVALAQAFAIHASTAIDNARLFEDVNRRAAELEAVRQASLSLTASLELRQVFDAILDSVLELLPDVYNGHIFLYDAANDGRLTFGSALTVGGKRGELYAEPRPDGLTYTVARNAEAIIVPNMRAHPIFAGTPPEWNGAIIGLPLKIGERVVGVMNISYVRPRTFSQTELRILQLLGDQAAIAIENASLYEQAAIEQQHLRLLYDIGRELAATLEPDDIFNRAVTLTARGLGGLVGQAFSYLADGRRLSIRAIYGREGYSLEELDQQYVIRLGDGLVGWVAEHREALYLPDVNGDSRWMYVPGIDEDVRAAMSAPIVVEDRLLGVLSVLHQEPGAFSQAHLALLQAISQAVGLALVNASRYQQVQRRLAEMTLIQEIAQTIARRVDVQELLDEVVTQIASAFGYPQVHIFLIQDKELVIRAYYGQELDKRKYDLSNSVIGQAATTGQPIFSPGVIRSEDSPAGVLENVAEIAVPIYHDKLVIGVISIGTHLRGQLTKQDQNLIEVLAGQVSIALENAVLYERVRRHAEDLEREVAQRTAELVELYELSQKISYTGSYDGLLRLLLNHLRNAVRADLAMGYISHGQVQVFIIEASRPLATEVIDHLRDLSMALLLDEAEDPASLSHFQLEVIRAEDYDPQATPISEVQTLIQAPITLTGGEIAGVLIAASDQPGAFNSEQERLHSTFANQASAAYQRLSALLAEEQKRLEGLVEHLPVGVLLIDADYRLLVANPEGRALLAALNGQERQASLNQIGPFTMRDLVSAQDDSSPVEIVIKEPTHLVVEAQARAVGGEDRYWVITLRDVTQERENQERIQMQERLATVGQLAAGIAHDFNNIMAAILVYADLLTQEPDLSQTSREQLSIIQKQVQRSTSLIRQILDFSRRSIMEQATLDLLPFVKELDKMLGRVLPENIQLELSYHSGNYQVKADPTRLQQVFMNLAVNARDAMPDGGMLYFELGKLKLGDVDQSPIADMPPGAYVTISVRDTGKGISPEHMPHIFEPFFTTKPAGVGTGLGLAQVYGIIKQHDGYIDVDSKLGQGTQFRIYLPELRVTEQVEQVPLDTLRLDGDQASILVVEDDLATREAMRALLEAHNFRVALAQNGEEALDYLDSRAEPPELIISDIVMPKMGGFALFQALETRDQKIKILFVTGHPLEGESQAFLERGDVRWLQKPFSVREFNQIVFDLLQTK